MSNTDNSSPTPAAPRGRLIAWLWLARHLPPTLNKVLYLNRWKAMRLKKEDQAAVVSALQSALPNCETPITTWSSGSWTRSGITTLLVDDTTMHMDLEIRQEKCPKKEAGTLIEIFEE